MTGERPAGPESAPESAEPGPPGAPPPDGAAAPAPEAPPAAAPPAHWGPWSALAVLALAHLGQIVLWTILGGFATLVLLALDPSLESHPEQLEDAMLVVCILPVALSSALLTVALVHASVSGRCRLPFFSALGLRWPGAPAAARYALAGAGVAFAGASLILAFPPGPRQEVGGPLSRLVESGGFGYAAWAFLGVVVAPVTEELLFRGYAYLGLRRRMGPVRAGLLITVLFVLPHMAETRTYWPALAGITMLAIFLVRTMESRRNLTCCIMAHAGYNGSLAVLSVLGPG